MRMRQRLQWAYERVLSSYRRTRALVFTLIILLPLLIAAGTIFAFRRTVDLSTAQVLSESATDATLHADVLNERFKRTIGSLLPVADHDHLRTAVEQGDTAGIVSMLKELKAELPSVTRVFVADPAGVELADYPALGGVIGKDFSYRDWYKGVSNGWQPYVSNVYKRTAVPQIEVVAFALPVRSLTSNDVVGILVAQVQPQDVFSWTSSLNKVGSPQEVQVVDRNGSLVHGLTVTTGGSLTSSSDRTIIANVLAGRSGAAVTRLTDRNEDAVVAYAPLTDFGWGVITYLPTRIAFSDIWRNLMTMLATETFLYLAALMLIVLVLLIMRRLARMSSTEKAYLQSAGDAIVVIDKRWNILLWNSAATKLTGWKASETVGRPFREVVRFIDKNEKKENVLFISDAMLMKRTQHIGDNAVLVRKDGSEVPVGDSAAPVVDEDGNVTGAVVVFRDATDEVGEGRLRSGFSYAAGKLHAPVSRALWSLDIALEERDPQRLVENVRSAREAVRAVAKLVDEIALVSRIEQKMFVAKKEKVDLGEMLDDVVADLQDLAARHQEKIEVKGTAAEIVSDRVAVRRVISEVVENAIVYGRKYGTVVITFLKTDGVPMLKVEDQGIGIDEAQQTSIFTKFFRGDNVAGDNVGAGLGLYIAKSLIDIIGGQIWFSSQRNKGTTFYVRFGKGSGPDGGNG